MCEALIYLLDNIYIRFGTIYTKLYRQNVGIPMGTNCAPLVADLFLFCNERDFMTSLQLNKTNTSDTEAPFLDLHLSISNGFVSSKIYIFQLIRFARVCSHVADFNTHNKSLTAKLLQQGYRYHKLRKTFSKFSKFYCRHFCIKAYQNRNFMVT